jgi:hypothetical protein
MNRVILVVPFWLVIAAALLWPATPPVDGRSSRMQMKPVVRCIQDAELRERLATMKREGGPDVAKVYEALLAKARTSSACRTEVIEALIKAMEKASKDPTNQNERFFLWQHGAGLLADLKATEALDLLVANIDFTDGWSASISEYHSPVLVSILEIGSPAIPKLHVLLKNDSVPHRRKFAAFAIAYIGGREAREALSSALPDETDPCVKKFLQLSLQAFDNKAKPNHISSELRVKWMGAFYCLQSG